MLVLAALLLAVVPAHAATCYDWYGNQYTCNNSNLAARWGVGVGIIVAIVLLFIAAFMIRRRNGPVEILHRRVSPFSEVPAGAPVYRAPEADPAPAYGADVPPPPPPAFKREDSAKWQDVNLAEAPPSYYEAPVDAPVTVLSGSSKF